MWNNKLVLHFVKVGLSYQYICVTPYTTRLREPEDERCVSAVLIHIVYENTYPVDV